MAQESQPGSCPGFTENTENTHPAGPLQSLPSTPANTKDRNVRSRAYLEELNAGALHNALNPTRHTTASSTDRTTKTTKTAPGSPEQVDTGTTIIDSLAEDLSSFHIYSPGNECDGCVEPAPSEKAGQDDNNNNNKVQASTCPTPSLLRQRPSFQTKHAHFASPDSSSTSGTREPGSSVTGPVKHESFSELLSEPDIQYTIERHDTRKFDCILSLPRNAGDLVQSKQLRRVCSDASIKDSARDSQKIYFGCNVLHQRTRSNSSAADGSRCTNYTLIATPLQPVGQNIVTTNCKDNMLDTLLAPGTAAPLGSVEAASADADMASPRAFGASFGSATSVRAQSIPRSPSSSVARIEDTIEELDKLEEEFEAVSSIVHVKRVPSPDKEAQGVDSGKAVANLTKGPRVSEGALRATKQPHLTRSASARRLGPAKEPSKSSSRRVSTPQTGATEATTGSNSKRLSTSRPLSLLPPKPPAKSTKPPTRPTFELPGEAVARRLKEQREARLLAAAAAAPNTPKPAAVSNGPQLRRVRSMKPPTVPNFELPGEAISRRKREEHEAKIRQQEEEERKRREFKAKPIRLSVTPSTVPRETVASRARQNRMSMIGESALVGGGPSVPGSGPSSNKRYSMQPGEAANRVTSQNQILRGRGATLGPSASATGETSRAASTSTCSINGKRSTISVEDVQQQRLRGKEIVHRDNTLSSDRDRERRAREAIAKQARQDAAERSRVLSREWAEKQKLKAKALFSARTE